MGSTTITITVTKAARGVILAIHSREGTLGHRQVVTPRAAAEQVVRSTS